MEQRHEYAVDKKETFKRVKERLESVRLYKRFGFTRKEPNTTAAYNDTPRSYTGMTSDSTGDIAIHNIEWEERLFRQCEQVNRAMRVLSRRQREIIERRYLGDEEITDIHVYMDMCISERTYYYEKEKALYRLAFFLRLEVYEEMK